MKDVAHTLDVATRFDMTEILARYQKETRLPGPVLLEHEREIKRFLVLVAAHPGRYAMRGPLDDLWHTFLIFTHQYAEFCKSLGVAFIHHVPERPHATQEDKEKVNNSYLVFLRDYATVFREEPPRHLWPRPIGNGGVELPGCSICGSTCSHKCLA